MLAKALCARPAGDGYNLLYIVPEALIERSPLCKRLAEADALLEASKFDEFWKSARAEPSFESTCPGFEGQMRRGLLDLLSETFQAVPLDLLSTVLGCDAAQAAAREGGRRGPRAAERRVGDVPAERAEPAAQGGRREDGRAHVAAEAPTTRRRARARGGARAGGVGSSHYKAHDHDDAILTLVVVVVERAFAHSSLIRTDVRSTFDPKSSIVVV